MTRGRAILEVNARFRSSTRDRDGTASSRRWPWLAAGEAAPRRCCPRTLGARLERLFSRGGSWAWLRPATRTHRAAGVARGGSCRARRGVVRERGNLVLDPLLARSSCTPPSRSSNDRLHAGLRGEAILRGPKGRGTPTWNFCEACCEAPRSRRQHTTRRWWPSSRPSLDGRR